jgi:hypothetical protein
MADSDRRATLLEQPSQGIHTPEKQPEPESDVTKALR